MDNNIFKKFSDSARRIITESQRIAKDMRQALSTEHLLIAMTVVPGTLSYEILHDSENMVNVDQIRLILSLRGPESNLSSGISSLAKEVLEKAAKEAAAYRHSQIDAEHIFLGIADTTRCLAYQILLRLGINPKNMRHQILGIFDGLSAIEKINQKFNLENLPRDILEPAFGSNTTLPIAEEADDRTTMDQLPALNFFSVDLTQKAASGQFGKVVGREVEISRIIQTLARKTKNNPVLIGDSGVGKTAIVEGLAQRIAAAEVPTVIQNRRLFSLDLALMVAGTTYRGQFEQRLKKVLTEVKKNPDIIVFLDELHTLVGAGSAEGSMDAANILKPALAKGEIRLIGATTYDEYRKYIEKDAALERRLQPILVKEPTINQTVEILAGIRPDYEKHHQVKITDQALIAAASLSARYITDRFLPDKAIDLMDESAAGVQVSQTPSLRKNGLAEKQKILSQIILDKDQAIQNQDFEKAAWLRQKELQVKSLVNRLSQARVQKKNLVTEQHIAKIVGMWTGIPVGSLMQSDRLKFRRLENILRQEVIGQDEAIAEVARVIKRSKTGIHNPTRPLGSFIFLGPTGCGKTHLAKTLAKTVFGLEEALIKVDMSEFMERHTVSQLIGAPPGYIGYEESGKLTESVRRQPYSVVLLDEIEKAHPEIFNILLQILEDGYLTDAKGRKINFRNTVIIMTSNIGAEKMNAQARIGFASEHWTARTSWREITKDILQELQESIRPELLNRIDKIVVFNPLDRAAIRKIVNLEVAELSQRLEKEKIKLHCTSKALNFIAQNGFEPFWGARPLRRAVVKFIEDPLSQKMLDGKIKQNQTVTIDAPANGLTFRVGKAEKINSRLARKIS